MRAYTKQVFEHFNAPRNVGRFEAPDAEGIDGSPGAGHYMVLQARVVGGVLEEVRFQTFGCPVIIACGSVTTEMATGKTVAEAEAIDAAAITEALGGVPEDKTYGPSLAAGALRNLVAAIAANGSRIAHGGE